MFLGLYSVMVQYHALGVLYHIRKSDRLAVNKLVAKFSHMSLKSPYGVCMLVSEYDYKYLSECLHHNNTMQC
jgi:coatomer protein complex subunit gamma